MGPIALSLLPIAVFIFVYTGFLIRAPVLVLVHKRKRAIEVQSKQLHPRWRLSRHSHLMAHTGSASDG